jgi:hypothetical protein
VAAGYDRRVEWRSHPCNCSAQRALVGTVTRLIRDERYRRVAVVLRSPPWWVPRAPGYRSRVRGRPCLAVVHAAMRGSGPGGRARVLVLLELQRRNGSCIC